MIASRVTRLFKVDALQLFDLGMREVSINARCHGLLRGAVPNGYVILSCFVMYGRLSFLGSISCTITSEYAKTMVYQQICVFFSYLIIFLRKYEVVPHIYVHHSE